MVESAVEASVRRLQLGGRALLVAVSGGVDSVVLLHALHAVAERWSLKLWVGHVNHGLRGSESEADESWVRGLAGQLGLPIRTAVVAPRSLRESTSNRERPTLQEAARILRYRELDAMAVAAGADFVATAHHADDQVETVLLRLLRGCGPDALGGISEISHAPGRVRPLLDVDRGEILGFARERSLEWREDSSNESVKYARNRLRHDWLPGLAEDFNPQLLRAIANLAEAQRRDSEWIGSLVAIEAERRFTVLGDGGVALGDGWAELPEALARRLAREALQRVGAGRDVSRVHLLRMLDFVRSGRPGTAIELPGGWALGRDASGLALRRSEEPGA